MTSCGLFPQVALTFLVAPPPRAAAVTLHCPVSSVDSRVPRSGRISQTSLYSKSTAEPLGKSGVQLQSVTLGGACEEGVSGEGSFEGRLNIYLPLSPASCLPAGGSKYTSCLCCRWKPLIFLRDSQGRETSMAKLGTCRLALAISRLFN